MTQSSTTTAEFLKTDLQGLGSIVTAARGFVADGTFVDLAPLDHEIKRICAPLTPLPSYQHVPLTPTPAAHRPAPVARLLQAQR